VGATKGWLKPVLGFCKQETWSWPSRRWGTGYLGMYRLDSKCPQTMRFQFSGLSHARCPRWTEMRVLWQTTARSKNLSENNLDT